MGPAHRRGVPAPLAGPRRPRTGGAHRPVRLAAPGPGRRGRPARRLRAAPVHPPAPRRRLARCDGLRARRDGPLLGPVHDRRARHRLRGRRGGRARGVRGRPVARRRRARAPHRGPLARRALEQAGELTQRLRAFLTGAARAQRLAPLAACAELVAARPTDAGGWEVVVVRHARLAATGVSAPGTDRGRSCTRSSRRPRPWHRRAAGPASHPHEAEILLSWLQEPGVRIVDVTGPWACRSARRGRTWTSRPRPATSRATRTPRAAPTWRTRPPGRP